jgi:hypothetical protein
MNEEQLRILGDWFTRVENYGRAYGRPLADHEIELARQVGVKDLDAVRIFMVTSMPPVPPELKELSKQHLNLADAAGLTVGHTILIIKGNLNAPLLKHELRHVHQVEEYPDAFSWLKAYIQQVLEVGYKNAPFEIDARNHEGVDAIL